MVEVKEQDVHKVVKISKRFAHIDHCLIAIHKSPSSGSREAESQGHAHLRYRMSVEQHRMLSRSLERNYSFDAHEFSRD